LNSAVRYRFLKRTIGGHESPDAVTRGGDEWRGERRKS
jgi:hypothetical protein